MTTIQETVSMLESMPEEARIKVLDFTKQLFTSVKPANPFTSVTADRVISDLDKSEKQFAEGKGMDMKKALEDYGKEHGFI